jgi:hypothetical protein
MSDCYPCLQLQPCNSKTQTRIQTQTPCACNENYFSVILGDVKTYSVEPSVHKLAFVRGTLVYDVNGEEVGVQVNISINKTVAISSNISLLNCTFIIF